VLDPNLKTVLSFMDFLNNDKEYIDAWTAEQASEAAYTDLFSDEMSTVSNQLNIIKMADDRATKRVGYVQFLTCWGRKLTIHEGQTCRVLLPQ
jgi:hypothetical protein